MSCDRHHAVLRLMAHFFERVLTEPDFERRVRLSDVLTEETISRVAEFDLLQAWDFDLSMRKLDEITEETARNQALIRAWQTSRTGQVQ